MANNARTKIKEYAAEEGLGDDTLVAFLCNFIDHEVENSDPLILERLQGFIDEQFEDDEDTDGGWSFGHAEDDQ